MFLRFKASTGIEYVISKTQIIALRIELGELVTEQEVHHLYPSETQRVANELIGEADKEKPHSENNDAVKKSLSDLDSLAKAVVRDLQKLSSKDEIKKRAYIIECLAKEPATPSEICIGHKELLEYIHKMGIAYDQEIEKVEIAEKSDKYNILHTQDSNRVFVRGSIAKANINTKKRNDLTTFFEKRIEAEIQCKVEDIPF